MVTVARKRRNGLLRFLTITAVVAVGAVEAQQSSTPHPKTAAQAPAAQAPRPAQIDRNGVLILVRSTLLALDHANKTGNYTVLRDLGAPGFQVNTPARLAEIFAGHRRDGLDLSGVSVIDPQFSLLPQIESNGLMRMTGFFPSVPKQVNFDLLFAPVGGQWRLFGISVALGQTAPAAPVEEPPARPANTASAPPSKGAPAKK
jgi:hypothetical protein